jgi:hypothetical protein
MAGNTANPRVWTGATVFTAPLATAAPTDVTTAWAAAWLDLGLIGEDGISQGREQDSDDKYAHGGILVRTVRSKFKRTFTVVALEDTPAVFNLLNPGSTATTSAGPAPPAGVTTRSVKVPIPDPRAFGIEVVDGLVIKRYVVARAEVTDVGETTLDDTELQAVEFTVTVYPSASTGEFYKEITNDTQAVVV